MGRITTCVPATLSSRTRSTANKQPVAGRAACWRNTWNSPIRASSQQISYARIVSVKILVKSLIVWFLLLAVPFQGFASATMLFCAPMQSPAALTRVSVAAAPAHDHQAMLAMQAAGHDHHGQEVHATGHHAPGASSAGHHDSGKCNACAACCFGASMAPSSSARLAVEMQHFAAAPFDTGFIPTVALALPERPPQASLI